MTNAIAEARIEEGNARYRRGDLDGAIACYEAAAIAEPTNARARFNLGVALQDSGRSDEALREYRRAVEADARHAPALVNWANLLRERGEAEAAETLYRRVLEIAPDDAHALNNLASLALQRRDHDEALELFARAAELGHAEAHVGNGDALAALGRFGEAIASYERALERGVRTASLLHKLATARMRTGDFATARNLFMRASETNPAFRESRFSAGLLALAQHDFAEGWEIYEMRFELPPWKDSGNRCDLPVVRALGELEPGRRVAIPVEQGVGDQILFTTLLPDLVERGVAALVELDSRLLPAYRRRFPTLRFVGSAEAPQAFREAEVQVPLGSLPRLLRRSIRDFERQPCPLLEADAQAVRSIAARMPAGPRIAIAWKSFREGDRGTRKSMPLEGFGAFEAGGARLIDVQYGDVGAERAAFDARHPGLRSSVVGLDVFDDLEGVMAALSACDLVVTTSNVTAHLAGAIGKRTWLVYLEANAPFHYWVPGPDGRSLWYPSVEIMTDKSWTTWEQAMEAVAERWGAER